MRRLLLVLFVVLSVSSFAQNVETVILKDGSKLSGYVNVQYPGKCMLVTSCVSEVSIPTEMVWTIENTMVSLSNLGNEWSDWAKDNGHLVKEKDGEKYINMSSLTLKNGGKIVGDVLQAYCMGKETYKGEIICPDFVEVPQQVCIIERGDILKYVSFDTLTFYVPYANVKEIVRPARKMEELSGLIDEIETREGMIVKGKIIRQEVGVSVCLKTENGILEVISNKNILAQRKLPLNGNMSIFEQSQFLDVVRLKDDKEYEGVLIEQNYGSSSIPGYFVILTQDGKSHKKKLSDLKCTVKKLNPEYLNLFDIILDKYEFVVNRQKVDAVNIMRLEVTREIVLPSDKSISVENLVANTIPVDSPCLKIKKSSLVDNKIQFEFKNGIDKRFLIIRPIVRERKQAKYESFTDNEFRSSGIHPLSTSISKNNTVKLEYDVVNLDKFLIYNEKEGLAIYCKIEE